MSSSSDNLLKRPPLASMEIIAGNSSGFAGCCSMRDGYRQSGDDIVCLLRFRYGREDEEVMGLKFCNEAIIALKQIWPTTDEKEEMSPLQVRQADNLMAVSWNLESCWPSLALRPKVFLDEFFMTFSPNAFVMRWILLGFHLR